MTFVSRIVGAAVLLAACSGPAFAGEPGKTKLQPLYSQPQKQVEYHTQTYIQQDGYSYAYTTSKSDVLNLKEYKRLQEMPKPQPKIIYQTHTSQPQYTYTYTHVQQPPVTCGDYYTYTSTAGCVAPPPPPPPQPHGCINPCGTTYTYHQPVAPPPPPPPPPPPEPVYVMVESCGDHVIRRLKDTPKGQHQYSVCYSDLMHLPEMQRNMILLDRMETASERACRDVSMTVYSLRAKTNCKNDTLANSVYEANLPGLVDAYYIRTGKVRPHVHVGKPIMN